MLSQNALTVFLKASDDVTECLALSVFKCPHSCLIGLMNFKISWYLVFLGIWYALYWYLIVLKFILGVHASSNAC